MSDQGVDTSSGKATLKRSIGLPALVLYGVGTMLGAGIYVLIGATAGRAGLYAPFSFLIAAAVMAPTAASFAVVSHAMAIVPFSVISLAVALREYARGELIMRPRTQAEAPQQRCAA